MSQPTTRPARRIQAPAPKPKPAPVQVQDPDRRTLWKVTELNKLRRLWPKATADALKKALPGRAWPSIQRKACDLKLVRTVREWPAAQIELLDALFPTKGRQYVAELLGRTPAAVSCKASLRGLVYTPAPTPAPAPKPAPAPRPKAVVVPVAKRPAVRVAPAAPAPAPAPVPVPTPQKKAPGTPNLNAQKAKRAKRDEPNTAPGSVEYIKKLAPNHPERVAYSFGGWRAWEQLMQKGAQVA